MKLYCNMETKCGRFDKVIQNWPDSRHDSTILPDDVYVAPIKIEGPTFFFLFYVSHGDHIEKVYALFILRNLLNRSQFGLC